VPAVADQLAGPLALRTDADTHLVECAAGVDGLYLSGRGRLRAAFLERLESGRPLAEAVAAPLPFRLGELTLGLAPHGWGRYRYLLGGEVGRIGFSTGGHLPEVRLQPRAELLHAIGAAETVALLAGLLGEAVSDLRLGVSRLDVFSDWQGWQLDASQRERFVCRADHLRLYEDGGAFTGFSFGSRTTKTFSARIYDKTAEIRASGADWWPAVWGERYRPGLPVLRVELEVGRTALAEFGLDTPAEALAGVAALWSYGTHEWLTYRSPSGDRTRSRWPVAPEWRQVQGASLAGGPIGHERVRRGRRAGSLRRLFPGLAGYLASFAAAVGTNAIEDTLVALDGQLRNDEIARRTTFAERIRRRREELSQL
jgi:hypothetical protein